MVNLKFPLPSIPINRECSTFSDKTACKPAGPDHLSDNPRENLQGHQNYILKVAMETLMTASR